VYAAVGDKLYVPTLYYQGGEWPDKVWNANVEDDPHVRLQIGWQAQDSGPAVLLGIAPDHQAASF
jgi:hypothetical protein